MIQTDSIEIPCRDADGEQQVLEIFYHELTEETVDEILPVLKDEKSDLRYWICLADEFYRRLRCPTTGVCEAFEKVLNTAKVEANLDYASEEVVQEDRVCLIGFQSVFDLANCFARFARFKQLLSSNR